MWQKHHGDISPKWAFSKVLVVWGARVQTLIVWGAIRIKGCSLGAKLYFFSLFIFLQTNILFVMFL
jgi:hypothetical protein